MAAREVGFTEREDIDLTLVRETSWANIRDRLAIGHFNAAHVLAPMPVAANLGLNPLASETIAPMALGLGGNAVTVSNPLWAAMEAQGAPGDLDPLAVGAALKRVVEQRKASSEGRPRFAVVHPHSGHNYELRYWLAACCISPESDLDIVIVPPSYMVDALGAGSVDAYCVGEPWNTEAVLLGKGRIVTVKAAIWKSSPEKVFGVQAQWAAANPEALAALLRALYRVALWCSDPTNRNELARLLSGPAFVGKPVEWLVPALSGVISTGPDIARRVDDFFIPHAKAATFLWRSHALWLYTQMVRWGQATHTPENERLARETYRPDLYRQVLKPLGVALPGANAKVESALTVPTAVGSAGASRVLGPDGFFYGRIFDPDRLGEYLAQQGNLPFA